MWRSFATDWGVHFWPEVGGKSGPPQGQSRGLYIALDPCQFYLLLGKTLMLTRCCENEGPQTDIHVNKPAPTPTNMDWHKHKRICSAHSITFVNAGTQQSDANSVYNVHVNTVTQSQKLYHNWCWHKAKLFVIVQFWQVLFLLLCKERSWLKAYALGHFNTFNIQCPANVSEVHVLPTPL